MTAWPEPRGRAASILRAPVTLAILAGVLVGAVLVLVSGGNPARVYVEIVAGALAPARWGDTVAWMAPVVGMALVAALPLRAGHVNLGGDGQLVLGGMAAVVLALWVPGPPVVPILGAMAAGALWASLAAVGQVRAGVPLLISSLLLSYVAMAGTSWMAGFPLRDLAAGLPQTRMVPQGARLPDLIGPLSLGAALIAAVAVAAVAWDRLTVGGYELRMTGLNPRFARAGGVDVDGQTVAVMAAAGAIAGLVGATIVLGEHLRFQDGALISPAYTWSGLLAALLARGSPLGAVAAAAFFAALQSGGFAMQRETQIPRELGLILQSLIILFLAMRHGLGR